MKKIIYYRSKDGKSFVDFMKKKQKENDTNFDNHALISNGDIAVLKEFEDLDIDSAVKEVYEV